MLFLIVTSLLLLCCAGNEVHESKESKLAKANNDLAFDLIRSYSNEKNVFVSPLSISTALAMVYIGADGNTAKAMGKVLKYDSYGLEPEDVPLAFQSLLASTGSTNENYQLSTFNNAMVASNFSILDSYELALRKNFNANIDKVDFASHGQEIKTQINSEVKNATNGKIADLLDEPPSKDTKLFLLNAVYFFGNWDKPFDPHFTFQKDFYNKGVHAKMVPTMKREGAYRHFKSNSLSSTVVVMPYKGNNTASMIVVLPNQRDGVTELQRSISEESLAQALEEARYKRIALTLPKFSLSYKANLVDSLSGLGLTDLFNDEANLDRIAGTHSGLRVSKVMHKAVIDVNEKGSEAAAATGIEIGLTSVPPSVNVDHPFLFFIRENNHGTILFAGRVDEL